MTKHGYFSKDDKFNSFILTDPMTPRPWQQYLFNETMLFQIDQFGQGLSRYWDEKGRDVIRKFLLEIAEFERNERKKKASEMTIKIGREVNMIRLH